MGQMLNLCLVSSSRAMCRMQAQQRRLLSIRMSAPDASHLKGMTSILEAHLQVLALRKQILCKFQAVGLQGLEGLVRDGLSCLSKASKVRRQRCGLAGGSRNKGNTILIRLHDLLAAQAELTAHQELLRTAKAELQALAGAAKEHRK